MRPTRRDLWDVVVQNLGTDTVKDKFGNPIEQYEEPFTIKATMTVGGGNSEGSPYGWNIDYDREMVVHKDYGINEYSKVFITQMNRTQEFRVKAVGVSKHLYRYALRLVEDV